METATLYDRTVYLNTTLTGDNPIRVGLKTHRIEINPNVFYKLPEQFQYFLLRWAVHRTEVQSDMAADVLAIEDYSKKNYSMKTFYTYMQKLIARDIGENAIRRKYLKTIIENHS